MVASEGALKKLPLFSLPKYVMPSISYKHFLAKVGKSLKPRRPTKIKLLGTVGPEVHHRTVFGDVTAIGRQIPEREGVDIKEEIEKLRDYWLRNSNYHHEYKDINCGDCFAFAEELHQQVGGQVVGIGDGVHGWLFWNGKYYDAEVPDGVTQLENLPFFVRNRTNKRKFSEWDKK